MAYKSRGWEGALRGVGLVLLAAAGLFGLLRLYSEPLVRVVPDFQRSGKTYPAVPVDSVRILPYLGGEGCSPFDMLARLHVYGRFFAPSDSAVWRALRRQAATLGANAIAPSSVNMNDLPVLGVFDTLFGDGIEEDDWMRHNEGISGRAIAIRCNAREIKQP
jgi:hypothetical protein